MNWTIWQRNLSAPLLSPVPVFLLQHSCPMDLTEPCASGLCLHFKVFITLVVASTWMICSDAFSVHLLHWHLCTCLFSGIQCEKLPLHHCRLVSCVTTTYTHNTIKMFLCHLCPVPVFRINVSFVQCFWSQVAKLRKFPELKSSLLFSPWRLQESSLSSSLLQIHSSLSSEKSLLCILLHSSSSRGL